MNNIIENMLTRRSIRKYKNEQVSDENLEMILTAAKYAPSGFNSQSWHFTVIQNQDKLIELNNLIKTAFSYINVEDPKFAFLKLAKANSEKEGFSFNYNSPTLIIVSNEADYSNSMADSSCAMQNMFLAAHSLGLGTCWINVLTGLSNNPVIKNYLNELGVPTTHKICGAVSLGYSAMPELSAPPRKENTVTIVK
ncbi:MAG: nitroreductase [Clostridium sp.]